MKTQKQQLVDSINEYVSKNGIGTINEDDLYDFGDVTTLTEYCETN